MRQYGLLAAIFGGTLAVLLVAFLVIEQLGAGGAIAAATPSPSPSQLALASPTPRRTAAPVASASPKASASVRPSASAPTRTAKPTAAAPTPRPTPTAAPSTGPGSTIEVVVLGAQYIDAVVPENAKVTKLAAGGVKLSSDRLYSDPTTVTWELPAGKVPAGTTIARLDVAVCGSGQGDFWETYGPADAEPVEHEVVPPDSDGCWHYLGGSGTDTTVHAIIHLLSVLEIDKVVYTITTG